MPRHIDREQRRRDILQATREVLAQEGLRAVSFRAVAQHLGGSTTLVTHYFNSQTDLLDALAFSLMDTWDAELGALESQAQGPVERLRLLLHWLVPQNNTAIQEERARILLLSERLLGDETQAVFSAWDARMMLLIRNHLAPLVPHSLLEVRADVLRSVTNGLTLSILENPHTWDQQRIADVIEQVIADLGTSSPAGESAARTSA